MTIAREEIFGPVLVIMPYEDEEDAVRIANATDYGLAGGVWSASRSAPSASPAGSAPARSRSTAAPSTRWRPFGGYKQSGHGRELGPYGIEEFLVLKSMQL